MLRLLLVRHAQCDMNLQIEHRIGGRTNASPLTPLGERQAAALGAHLAAHLRQQQQQQHAPGDPPAQLSIKFFSSTAVRAVHTAQHILDALQVDREALTSTEQLLELDQGEWEGALRRKCYTHELTEAFAADPWGTAWTFAAPGGESQQAVEQRFVQYVQQHILPALTAGGGPAIIVSHGMAIKCFLRSLLGSLPTMSRQIALGNTAVTEVGWLPSGGGGGGGGNWHILSVNNLSHLPLEMRT